jgi:adenylosuccinate lyase
MSDHGLLSPGTQRTGGGFDDEALVDAMLRVEVAWLRALAAVGAVDAWDADAVATAADGWQVDLDRLGAQTEAAGNPVVPLVAGLRAAVGDQRLAGLVHRGLTSQDVLDSALVLLARDALSRTRDELTASAGGLAGLAARHRETVMVGRTLSQYAVPVTFGLKAAQWLAGVLDAQEQVETVLGGLPVQCGGAAGTLALAGELTADPVGAAQALAQELGLRWPGVPWHTNRSVVTRIGGALVGACDALGVLSSDVALMSRPSSARSGRAPSPGGVAPRPCRTSATRC